MNFSILYYQGKDGGAPVVLDGSKAENYELLISSIEAAIDRTNEVSSFASGLRLNTGIQVRTGCLSYSPGLMQNSLRKAPFIRSERL